MFGESNPKIKTFAIISPQNPLGAAKSTDEEYKQKFAQYLLGTPHAKAKYNADKVKEMKSWSRGKMKSFIKNNGDAGLKVGNFSYSELKGFYGGQEKSLIIYNLNIIDAEKLAHDYGQESFFYAKRDGDGFKITYYESYDGCSTYEAVETSKTVTDEEDALDYFSQFGNRKNGNKPLRFKINMNCLGSDVPYMDTDDFRKEFEESMSEENTSFMHRAIARRHCQELFANWNYQMTENSKAIKTQRLFQHPGAMKHIRTFAIFTAYNPDTKPLKKADNIELQKSLKNQLSYTPDIDAMLDDVINGRYHYYKSKGKYGNIEESLIVFNINLPDTKKLAAAYEQQSFVFGLNDDGKLKFQFWANYSKTGHKYKMVGEKDTVNVVDDRIKDNYTQIARDFKINIPFDVFGVAIEEMEESINVRRSEKGWSEEFIEHLVSESLSEEITGYGRYCARGTLKGFELKL